MDNLIYKIGFLAGIDERIDELLEEFGDLPEQAAEKKAKFEKAELTLNETEAIIKEIKEFVSKAKLTLVELKDKEDKLKEQQFGVTNNKEFDAITNEIAYLKREHSKLSDQFRAEGLKLENLTAILQKQRYDLDVSKTEYEEKTKEIEDISGEQKAELATLNRKREVVENLLDTKTKYEYARIRKNHNDAAVSIIKGSCTGCYSSIPPQIAVDVRTNLNVIHYCENCGRILISEDFFFDEDVFNKL